MALTGTETLYVLGQDGAGHPAASTQQVTTAQIAALASNFSNDSPTAVTNTTGTTITAAALISGLINRTGPTANFTDTTDTASAIVTALGSTTGDSFYIDIKNTTAFAQTINGGTGVTFSSNNIILPNSIAEYLVVINSATTVTFNHVFTTLISDTVGFVSTALATVGAGTITGTGIVGGLTTRSGAQAATAFTDTTDTAANIITAQANAHVGISWMWYYQNTTNAPATITGGANVTVSGVTVVPANTTAEYLVTYTAANTITIVGFGVNNNPVTGTFTANGVTGVVVANTAISPNSTITYAVKTIGGTPAGKPYESSVTPGTGFTAKAFAGDTSVYNYAILG